MVKNLLGEEWARFDSNELRILLDKHVGGPGQYDCLSDNPDTIYLPLARDACKIAVTYREGRIVALEPGSAFDSDEWAKISERIEESVLSGPVQVGRFYSFASSRVLGSWRGARSGIQILPPAESAPRAPALDAEHPLILQYPVKRSDYGRLNNYRLVREHHRFTRLLNVLLRGYTCAQPERPRHFWAQVGSFGAGSEIKWVQEFFFAKLDNESSRSTSAGGGDSVERPEPLIIPELSPPVDKQLEQVDPEEYYNQIGRDEELRVPANLDEVICRYNDLTTETRDRFDRAAYWIDWADRLWTVSASASYAARVTAIESLTERGQIHQFDCPVCERKTQHEYPGATRRFHNLVEKHAPGMSLKKRRNQMYALRSQITHGSGLMHLDRFLSFERTPEDEYQSGLHRELWQLALLCLRNWLWDPS